ncbi:Hypothetical predicted protein [Paramuricea clavata]|uniref:Uncharacterized protein n=1 Tax=Paramuricea clavata TaxID=317549 RepID=A0A7D9IP99_PARCT|nr:Hypothetical predicted protein [Paramuricea clavata]
MTKLVLIKSFNWRIFFLIFKGSTSCGMTQSVYGFLVYHAAVGQRVLPEHFNFQAGCVENVINVEAEPWEYQLCRKVIEMFSRPGDWVLDINLPKVTGIAAALSTDRNGLCLVKNEEERQTAREILSELV